MTEIAILALKRVLKAVPNKTGNRVIAYFDCATRGFILKGCALVQSPKLELFVWPPRMLDNPSWRCIKIDDNALNQDMMTQARDAYRALGGTDDLSAGPSDPELGTPANPIEPNP